MYGMYGPSLMQIMPDWMRQLGKPGQGPAIGPIAPQPMITPDQGYAPQPLWTNIAPPMPKFQGPPIGPVAPTPMITPIQNSAPQSLQMWLPADPNEQGARNIQPGMMEPLQANNPDIPVKWVDNYQVMIPPEGAYVKDILSNDHPLLKKWPHMGNIPVYMVDQLAKFERQPIAGSYSRTRGDISLLKGKPTTNNFWHELQHAVNQKLLGSEMPKDVVNSVEELMAVTNNVVFPSKSEGKPTQRLKVARRALMQHQLDRDEQGGGMPV